MQFDMSSCKVHSFRSLGHSANLTIATYYTRQNGGTVSVNSKRYCEDVAKSRAFGRRWKEDSSSRKAAAAAPVSCVRTLLLNA